MENPISHANISYGWFDDGCYRKHRKKKFQASDDLEQDLEVLFLEGFQTEGPKKGKNKYTPEQALAYLKNLKLPNGRWKYSNNKENPCGPLPTKLYIQGKFSRQKDKMPTIKGKKY